MPEFIKYSKQPDTTAPSIATHDREAVTPELSQLEYETQLEGVKRKHRGVKLAIAEAELGVRHRSWQLSTTSPESSSQQNFQTVILPLLLNVDAQPPRRKRLGAERLITSANHLVKLVPLRGRQKCNDETGLLRC